MKNKRQRWGNVCRAMNKKKIYWRAARTTVDPSKICTHSGLARICVTAMICRKWNKIKIYFFGSGHIYRKGMLRKCDSRFAYPPKMLGWHIFMTRHCAVPSRSKPLNLLFLSHRMKCRERKKDKKKTRKREILLFQRVTDWRSSGLHTTSHEQEKKVNFILYISSQNSHPIVDIFHFIYVYLSPYFYFQCNAVDISNQEYIVTHQQFKCKQIVLIKVWHSEQNSYNNNKQTNKKWMKWKSAQVFTELKFVEILFSVVARTRRRAFVCRVVCECVSECARSHQTTPRNHENAMDHCRNDTRLAVVGAGRTRCGRRKSGCQAVVRRSAQQLQQTGPAGRQYIRCAESLH